MVQANCPKAVPPSFAYIVAFVVKRRFAALDVVYSGGSSDVVITSSVGPVDRSNEGKYCNNRLKELHDCLDNAVWSKI